MRILHVVALVSPDGAFGGPARVAFNQCAELMRQGHDVTLAAGSRGYRTSLRSLDGVPVKLFAARRLVPGRGFSGIGAPGLVRWLGANASNFDAVHVHFGRDLVALPATARARRSRIPYVLQTHGMVVPSRHPLAGPLDAVWTRRMLRDAGAVLYLTDTERARLEEVAGREPRLIRLRNGVPTYPSAPRDVAGPPEVLFVARLHARKRPMAFVEMAKALLAEGVTARFTLIGPDEGEGHAVRAATTAQAHVEWIGALDPASIPARMARAFAYVLPAEREPYPMSVLEAMAVGLPVVVSADCGLASVVQRRRCGVVTDGTVCALVDAVATILRDEPGTRAMSDRARQTAERDFGMRAIGEDLIEIYRRIQTQESC